MAFDHNAEHVYYAGEPASPPTLGELDNLEQDMHLWVPDMPAIFHGKRILDLGAGTAPVGTVIARRCSPSAVVSVELLHHRLRQASQWAGQLRGLNLVCGDVFHLPFRDASFDYVVGNSILHHFPDVEAAIDEIARVLRVDGLYIGREPNFDNPIVRFGVFTGPGNALFGCSHSANEYPLRPARMAEAFAAGGCACRMRFFWRRFARLRHPRLSVAVSVTASRQPR